MTLTLRPAGLSRDPDRKDWSAYEDGQEIGRIYENDTARPEIKWFWSFYAWPLGPAELRRNGRAPTFEDAKSQFLTCREVWQVWPKPEAQRGQFESGQ